MLSTALSKNNTPKPDHKLGVPHDESHGPDSHRDEGAMEYVNVSKCHICNKEIGTDPRENGSIDKDTGRVKIRTTARCCGVCVQKHKLDGLILILY